MAQYDVNLTNPFNVFLSFGIRDQKEVFCSFPDNNLKEKTVIVQVTNIENNLLDYHEY